MEVIKTEETLNANNIFGDGCIMSEMFKKVLVTACHRTMFASQKHTHTQTHFFTEPQVTTPKFEQPLLLLACFFHT